MAITSKSRQRIHRRLTKSSWNHSKGTRCSFEKWELKQTVYILCCVNNITLTILNVNAITSLPLPAALWITLCVFHFRVRDKMSPFLFFFFFFLLLKQNDPFNTQITVLAWSTWAFSLVGNDICITIGIISVPYWQSIICLALLPGLSTAWSEFVFVVPEVTCVTAKNAEKAVY